jgi:predicted ATPase/DNA-binding winged helix-turn-helix (wHTH) protein
MDERSPHDEKGAVSFGPFRLLPAERLLEKDGIAVHVGGRALDILIFLVERAGEVVSKKDLVERVWADVTVDEGSLRTHMAALRKVLGDGQSGGRYITNVPGRGYCLVMPISRSNASDAGHVETTASSQFHTLPARLTRMVGREENIRKIAEELSARRFVSVVGPGGIGKTTVAVEVGHTLLAAFDGAVHFLDLGSLNDARLVPGALALTLGLTIHSDNPVPSLLTFLKDKRMLLVLDSCEHVIETLAVLTESIFSEAPQVHILVTSRESLRVEGERVHRLFPLDCPSSDEGLKASEVLAFPAAQLFIERVAANSSQFELSDSDAPIVAEICLKLDGIALAIELAAGQVNAYGIRGIATLLNDRFRLSWQGRRTALPRHQTLSAALDWSYNLLSELEREILRRLAVFVGTFTLEAARSVVAGDGIDEAQVVIAIVNLVAKSLLSSDAAAAPMRYRLLDTTRAYVLGKPIYSEKADAISRRHAVSWCQFLERAGAASSNSPKLEGAVLVPSRGHIGDVRAALEWSFSARGDLAVGTSLAAASAPFFLEMSLLTECHRWTERAILALDEGSIGTRREMELQASLGVSLMFTQGNKEEVRTAFTRGLELAEALGDPSSQLPLLRGLHIYLTRIGDFHRALTVGQRSKTVAEGLNDRAGTMMADWMLGVAHHLIGNQADAIVHCESAMTRAPTRRWSNIIRLGYDHRIIALVAFARALWLRGYSEKAVEVARYTVKEAELLGHPLTICISMIWTVYVFLWSGDWLSAEEIIERIIAHAAKHSLGPYHAVGLGLKGELSIKRGPAEAGVQLLRGCLETLHASRHEILTTVFASDLAEGLAMMGQFDEALATIDGAIAQVGGTGESFDMPEMLRIKGHILGSSARFDFLNAENCLLQSLERARKQSALAWELRTATTLARLWSGHNRAADGLELLAPVCAKFTEGFDNSDLKAAKHLLDELRRSATP